MSRSSNPNVVFILADDHGYGDISAHQGPGVQTPHIDAIAARVLYWVRREGWYRQRRCVGNDYHAVRQGELKLLHDDAFAPLELFDIAADERETVDLAASRPEAMEELCRLMQENIRLAGSVPWQRPRGGPQTCSP